MQEVRRTPQVASVDEPARVPSPGALANAPSAGRSVGVTLAWRAAIADPDYLLVQRSLRGDTSAFASLVQRHRAVTVRVAARIVGHEEAEDVAQEALLKAFDRLERFRGDAPFRSWLLSITHNAALNSVGRTRPLPIDFEREHAGTASLPGDERDPLATLERAEQRRHIRGELSALRPSYGRLIVLRDLEGHSYEEIAALLQMPLGSVKGGLYRARRQLIERLRASAYDWELPAEENEPYLELAA